jgi:hypothetical protein
MNEHEERAIALAGVLHAGLCDMIDRGLLSRAAIPKDHPWLLITLDDLADALAQIAETNRKERAT